MEYICSQFPIDFEIRLLHLNLLIKTALTLTSVQEPHQTPKAKYRRHYNPASEHLQDFQVSLRVENTQNESVNIIDSNCRLRNIVPEFPPIE